MKRIGWSILLLLLVCALAFPACNKQSSQPIGDPVLTKDSIMVWIPRTGRKYHKISYCSNMKDPKKVSVEEAEAFGYEPCKNCYR